MTERSITAGLTPNVVIQAAVNATIEGWEGDRIVATSEERRGLKMETRAGGYEVSSGGSCLVRVPVGSSVKVYSGKGVAVSAVRGAVTVFVGGAATLINPGMLVNLSAGSDASLDCAAVVGDNVKLTAGRDFRCCIRDLSDTTIVIHDIGGPWEVTFGEGRRRIQLKAGGDVTLVTDQTPSRTSAVVGRIERP